jgi:hypothetical protein
MRLFSVAKMVRIYYKCQREPFVSPSRSTINVKKNVLARRKNYPKGQPKGKDQSSVERFEAAPDVSKVSSNALTWRRLSFMLRRASPVLFVLMACIVFFLFLRRGSPSPARVNLSEFGDISFEYDSPQGTGISPLCGCVSDLEADEWRGLTFVAQNLELHRSGGLPLTEYFITGAVPNHIKWRPSLYQLQCNIYEIALPLGEAFDPAMLVHKPLPASYTVIAERKSDPHEFVYNYNEQTNKHLALGRQADGSVDSG